MANKDIISDELLAAFLDGNTNEEETRQVLQSLKKDKQLQEVLDVALQAESDISQMPLHCEALPMLQMAALSGENVCAVLCETFILQRHNIPYDKDALFDTARKNNWLKPEGTPLYCIGNLLDYSGFSVSRQYHSNIEDIRDALARDCDVIVGVDREKLFDEPIDLEDLTNHAVVVTDINEDTVTVFEPYRNPSIVSVPLADFLNAWKESQNYMVAVCR